MARPQIAEAVKDAVRAWAKAKDPDAGARALAKARQALPAELVPQLVSELAEIGAEILLSLLTREDGVDAAAAPVDVEGVALHPKQAERLGAWAEDQVKVAKALGLDGPTWQKKVEQAMTTLGKGEGAAPADAPAAQISDSAKKLVGAIGEKFENRPEAGKSEQSGLRGLLAARGFAKKPPPKKR